jgi:hypothetical protein
MSKHYAESASPQLGHLYSCEGRDAFKGSRHLDMSFVIVNMKTLAAQAPMKQLLRC